MQTLQTLAVAAGAAVAVSAFGQTVRLTHNERTDVVDPQEIACTAHGAATMDNSWWRAFDLQEFGISGDLVVTSVEFGVARAWAPSLGGTQPVWVQLYQAPAGSRPATGLPARGGAEILIEDMIGSGAPAPLVKVDVDGRIDAGSTLIVSITPPDHTAALVQNDHFYIGFNSFEESDPTYLMAPKCGITQPSTTTELGMALGQLSVVMVVHGHVDGACYADCDASGDLDFFDFLCFQNLFAAGDPQADCDASGELDFFDFLCFQNEFAAGCP